MCRNCVVVRRLPGDDCSRAQHRAGFHLPKLVRTYERQPMGLRLSARYFQVNAIENVTAFRSNSYPVTIPGIVESTNLKRL